MSSADGNRPSALFLEKAYAYLKRFKGIEHLREHYGVLHTQSFPDTVDVLAQVCLNNGGQLR